MRRKTAWLIGHVGLPAVLLATTSVAWQQLLVHAMSTENELFQLHGHARANTPRGMLPLPLARGPSGFSVDASERTYANLLESAQATGRSPVTEMLKSGVIVSDRVDTPQWK